METFFKFASPTTLASLWNDLDSSDDAAATRLRRQCFLALVANVGIAKADAMVNASGARNVDTL